MQLILEVTRRCNMKCEHCLRGNAQRKDMSPELLYNIFSKIPYVSGLVLTGGEPTLATNVLEKINENIYMRRTEISSFFMCTNGKTCSQDFLNELSKLKRLTDCEMIISYSDDQYHEKDKPRKGITKFMQYCDENRIELNKHTTKIDPYRILAMGKAKYYGCQELEIKNIELECPEIYINVNGDIINGCDVSFNLQDNYSFLKIGNIKSILNYEMLIQSMKVYNIKLEILKEIISDDKICIAEVYPDLDGLEKIWKNISEDEITERYNNADDPDGWDTTDDSIELENDDENMLDDNDEKNLDNEKEL